MASSGDGASGVAAVSATAASGQNDTGDKVVQVLHSRVGPEDCPHDRWIVCGQSIIGRRKKQVRSFVFSGRGVWGGNQRARQAAVCVCVCLCFA